MPIMEFENLPSKETPIIDKVLEELQTNLLKMVFPVGSIYWNVDANIDPAEELGFGKWELKEGVVFVGASRTDEDFYVSKKGGSKKHTLSVQELPTNTYTDSQGAMMFVPDGTGNWINARGGGGMAFNICQPYEVPAFAWVRTE